VKVLRPILVLLLLAAAPAIIFFSGRVSKPPIFDRGLTLAQAIEESRRTGTPVVAFATADWCAPCQQMKKRTLRDPSVAGFLRARTIPVYVDIERDERAAALLQVTGIPATVILAGDTIIARSIGALEPVNYRSFLEAAVGTASSPDEVERLRTGPR
jgi:thioredoxin-like negative regulator of GroEL